MVGGVDSGGGRHSRANVLRSSYYILYTVSAACISCDKLREYCVDSTANRQCITQSSDLLPKTRYFGAERTSKKLSAHPDRAAYLRRLSRARRTRADNWVACQFYAPFKKICGPYKHQICGGNPLTYTQGEVTSQSLWS